MSERATAFVPGHVTGFFTVDEGDDPTETGSRGCGIALSDGVTVRVERADERRVELDGETVEIAAVERVLDALRADAVVTAETPLPLGAGFGLSGALALGTALGTNAAYKRALSYNELVTLAHGAEVQAGTGLGDVVGQARGGVPIRLEPGSPEHNYVDEIPDGTAIEYYTLGELSTPEVVDGPTGALTMAGENSLSAVVKQPILPTFMRAARGFSREADLLTDEVREIIDDVAEAGGEAAMAMLGETVFALDTGLSDAGYDAQRCEVYQAGAHLTE